MSLNGKEGVAASASQCADDRPTYDLRFVRGATHLMVGPSGSGKTYRTCDILRMKDHLIEGGEDIKNVVFCYAAWQPIYARMQAEGVVTKFVKKKPTEDEFVELVKDYQDDGGSIVVLDDFMGQIDQDMMNIVTVHSRHYNATTFILFQSLFPPHRLARQISLNVKYIHAHKNPRENAQIHTLARQIAPKKARWIESAYHKVTEHSHSCFLIDLTQTCDEKLRFRSNYLPWEFPYVVWVQEGTV